MEDRQERLLRYLEDAWAVEKALVGSLQDMANATQDPKISALFKEHALVTHEQEERLEARIRALGGDINKGKGVVNTVLGKLSELAHLFHDEEDKTTQNLIKGFATENFETGMYESLRAYAGAIGDDETAALAQDLMAQEKEAARKVWALIAPAAVRVLENTPVAVAV
jgi:ferritin-like metal-binding protein YciE